MMEHQELKDALQLLACDELSPARERLLRRHLDGCPECRNEWEELQEWREMIQRHVSAPEPSEELLYQARSALQRRLRTQDSRSWGHRWTEWLSSWIAPIPQTAWVGGLMLLVGLGIGSAVAPTSPAGTPQGSSAETQPSAITNVRFLEAPSGQEIQLSYDEVRPVHLKGSPEDEHIRRVLAHAAVHDDNAGVRLQAVTHLDSQDFTGLTEVKRTLIASLVGDENPGVRRRALEALQKMAFDDETRQALLQVLRYDPNSGLRVDAINALEGAVLEGLQLGPEALEVVRERTAADDNNYVRRRAESFLREVDYR